MRNILLNKNYVNLQIAKFLFMIGIQMQSVAVGWHVYEITGSKLALGYSGLVLFLAQASSTILGGDAADRFNRKKIVLFAYIAFFLASSGLFLAGWFDFRNVNFIYLTLIFVGLGRGFYSPSMNSILPFIVKRDDLARAYSLGSAIWQTATISGPAIGGLIYGYTGRSYVVFGLVLVLTLVASLFLSFVQYKHIPVVVTTRMWTRFLEGLQFVKDRKIILGATSLDLFAVLLGGSVGLLPVFADDILKIGPQGLGFLRSAPALGAVLMALVLARRPSQSAVGKKMIVAIMGFGIATIIFGLSRNFYLSLFALFLLGICDEISVYVRGTLVQLHTPDAMRGRVSAVSSIFIGASNELGEFESGVTAHWFGTVPSVVIGGVGTIFVAVFWTRLFPELYKADKLE